jgi:hypothetical protein
MSRLKKNVRIPPVVSISTRANSGQIRNIAQELTVKDIVMLFVKRNITVKTSLILSGRKS